MKKVNYLIIILILTIITACSSSDSEQDTPLIDDRLIPVDYIRSFGSLIDFTVTPSGEVFYLDQMPSNSRPGFMSLLRVGNSGEESEIDKINTVRVGDFEGITHSNNNEILCTTDYNLSNSKIHTYNLENNNNKSIYEIVAKPHEFFSLIRNYGDDTFIFDDRDNAALRRYFPKENRETLITKTESFPTYIKEMIVHNKIIYVIDNDNSLKKIEDNNGDKFTVSTLIQNHPEDLNSITVDEEGNILLVLTGKGIYKLNSDNSLEEYYTKPFDISSVGLSSFNIRPSKIHVLNSDLYLLTRGDIIKISDYKSKLFK